MLSYWTINEQDLSILSVENNVFYAFYVRQRGISWGRCRMV